MNIVSADDVMNYLNIDIAKALGKTDNNTTFVEHWLERKEDEVIDFIGSYAWGGSRQARGYLDNAVCFEAIKKAVIEQVEYSLLNRQQNTLGGLIMGNADVKTVTMEDRLMAGIAPRAKQILENAKLLYRGRIW